MRNLSLRREESKGQGSIPPFGVIASTSINSEEVHYSQGHHMKLTAVFEKVPQGYIAFVEELPGANTQADSLDEARENLAEAVELVLEANRLLSEESLQGKDVIREPLILAAG